MSLKNKIEGTPILKLAIVKRLRGKENLLKNRGSSKNLSKKFIKKFVKNSSCEKNSSKRSSKYLSKNHKKMCQKMCPLECHSLNHKVKAIETGIILSIMSLLEINGLWSFLPNCD